MECRPTIIVAFVVMLLSSLVAFGVTWGLAVSVGAAVLGVCFRGPDWRLVGKRLAITFGASAVIWLFYCVLTPACGAARECARRMNCTNNMKQVLVALHDYAQANHDCFPPAYIADSAGRPMHSWRVLILPYIGDCEELYKRYDFSEPWDGPNNRKLLSECPSVYVCPRYRQSVQQSSTSYAAVVGKQAGWLGDKREGMPDIRPSDTIVLVEVTDIDIPWTQPRDLSLDAGAAVGLASVSPCRYHYYPEDALYYTTCAHTGFGLGDGSVRWWPMSVLTEKRFSSLLRAGGYDSRCKEIADSNFRGCDWGPTETHILWDNCAIFGVALLVWIASIGPLIYDTMQSWKRSPTTEEDAAGVC